MERLISISCEDVLANFKMDHHLRILFSAMFYSVTLLFAVTYNSVGVIHSKLHSHICALFFYSSRLSPSQGFMV